MENVEELEIPTCLPTLGTKKTRRLKRLIERARYLKQKIERREGNENSLHHSKTYLSALRYLIEYILIKENILDAETAELKIPVSGAEIARIFRRLTEKTSYLKQKIEHKEGSEDGLRFTLAELSALTWAMEYVLIE